MTPLEAAKEAIRLADVYKLHPHPMGGHGDPVRGPGFDLDRHIRKHAIAIATALIEAEEKAKRNEAKLADVKCQLLDMLDLMPVPGSRWRMNIKAALRTIDAALTGDPK